MNKTPYQPAAFDLSRPPHLVGKELLERIEQRNQCKILGESFADAEQLVKQIILEMKADCGASHTADSLRISKLEEDMEQE